jgi:hypothetical protein
MKRSLIILLFLNCFSIFGQNNKPSENIKIGLLTPNLSAEEFLALDEFLENQKDFQTVKLSHGQILKNKVTLIIFRYGDAIEKN